MHFIFKFGEYICSTNRKIMFCKQCKIKINCGKQFNVMQHLGIQNFNFNRCYFKNYFILIILYYCTYLKKKNSKIKQVFYFIVKQVKQIYHLI